MPISTYPQNDLLASIGQRMIALAQLTTLATFPDIQTGVNRISAEGSINAIKAIRDDLDDLELQLKAILEGS